MKNLKKVVKEYKLFQRDWIGADIERAVIGIKRQRKRLNYMSQIVTDPDQKPNKATVKKAYHLKSN